ncbi:integral membrane protein S linking to the trans Golgi network-domain-containing protein [Crucibulum laeve]|uniref:Integral membrane protein S linking to the trans Golgi network-domain-containing protein n=1 Tax=Crucibulum laeve TaxID=68775 RepID=A0A5C3LZ20_9AGAR|nr:integral membrane protein S linking to the trans Golgi network-domain-containing protein [Crucibulum laeve]
MAPQKSPANTNWDPVLLISQIVSMQTLHYLTLSLLIPPLLSLFAEPVSLDYEGGAANIGMLMDWRELAGKPTFRARSADRWAAWYGGQKFSFEPKTGLPKGEWGGMGRVDPMRGWIIALCWIVACGADVYYLYHLIRRPRLILDFALTLVFNHLVLTTYYAASLPTSLFFWLVVLGGAALTVVGAEQLCVRREMKEGLSVGGAGAGAVTVGLLAGEDRDRDEEMEMGGVGGRRD